MADEPFEAMHPEEQRLYLAFAAAYVRGTRPELDAPADEATVKAGLEAGLRLHRFKRSRILPRVTRVLGILNGLDPTELLDIGSGRGAFLWPLLEAFPELPVTCIDADTERARQLAAVASGGIRRLYATQMDVTELAFDDDAFDVVTALEVLEHIQDVRDAVAHLVRVGRRFVVVSVPSRPDDNPEHLHLLTAQRLQGLFRAAGAERVDTCAVLGHLVSVVKL